MYDRPLRREIDRVALFSAHEHYRPLSSAAASLEAILENSYLGPLWTSLTPGTNEASRAAFLQELGVKSCLVWLKKSLKSIYGAREELHERNWEDYNERIKGEYHDPLHALRIYRDRCRFIGIIQDSFWNPGESWPEHRIFYPAFRINSFLYGYGPAAKDHNGNSARLLYGIRSDSIDEYVSKMEEVILSKVRQGCVALKSALAYDREISFPVADKRQAEAVLRKDSPSPAEIKIFGDYIFREICSIAGRLNIPFQIHTGLGLLWGSDPMFFEPVIRSFPEVKFVLLHGGFPWYHSVAGLLNTYQNVYADLSYLSLLSPTAATAALNEWLEVSNSVSRITWGSDCCSPEESFGAALVFRSVLKSVFCGKVASGYLHQESAQQAVRAVASENARKLYLEGRKT